MKRKRGRPKIKPAKAKVELLQVRLETKEKKGFGEAADIAGLALSSWVRERLRAVARKELEESGRAVPFLA